MENDQNINNRPKNPRKRKRSKEQIFKEDYLPLIIIAVAAVMILIFIIGSIVRAVQQAEVDEQNSIASSIAKEEEAAEVDKLVSEAEHLAMVFNYDGAITVLESFSGNAAEYPILVERVNQYKKAISELVVWPDNSKIPNLSFQQLIADPSRTFKHASLGSKFNANFITTDEFSTMIQQLYDNGYILVSLDDITDGTRSIPLKLPKDKKPVMLTQTQVNCYTEWVDSDKDYLPDAGGAGFASKYVLDANSTGGPDRR